MSLGVSLSRFSLPSCFFLFCVAHYVSFPAHLGLLPVVSFPPVVFLCPTLMSHTCSLVRLLTCHHLKSSSTLHKPVLFPSFQSFHQHRCVSVLSCLLVSAYSPTPTCSSCQKPNTSNKLQLSTLPLI